jgi:hypothetical protein
MRRNSLISIHKPMYSNEPPASSPNCDKEDFTEAMQVLQYPENDLPYPTRKSPLFY